MTVTNTGEQASETEDFTLSLDSQLDFISASAGGRNSRGLVTWRQQTVPGGTTRTYNVNVRLQSDASSNDELNATAFAGNAFTELTTNIEGTGNNEDDQDLSIDIEANKQSVEPGENVTYTVTITNNRSDRANNVEVQVTLDRQLDFQSASSGGRERGDAVVFADLSIPSNGSRRLSIVAEVERNAEDNDELRTSAFVGGEFAEVEIEVQDEDAIDNDDDRNLAVTLEASKRLLEPDEIFTYTVTVTNNGTTNANDAEVSLELDDRLEVLSSSNQGSTSGDRVVWDSLDIDAGRTRTLTVSLRVKEEAEDGDRLESTLIAEGAVVQDDLRVEDRNRGFERVLLHLFAEQDRVEPGDEITYTIRIENVDKDDETMDIVALLDPAMLFASASDDGLQFERYVVKWQDVFIKQNSTKTLTLRTVIADDVDRSYGASLIVHAGLMSREYRTFVDASESTGSGRTVSGSLRYDVRSDGARAGEFVIDPQGITNASQTNTARRVPTTRRTPVTQNTRQAVTGPAVAQLTVRKQANTGEVQPGSVVTYTLTVHNTSSVAAKEVVVRDSFPASSLEIVESGGGEVRPGSITWVIPTLAANGTWTISYQARASAELWHGETIESTVEVLHESAVQGYASNGMHVINQLPEAGFGSYTLALQAGGRVIRSAAAKAPVTKNTVRAPTNHASDSAYPLFWLTLTLLSLSVGMSLGLHFLKRTS